MQKKNVSKILNGPMKMCQRNCVPGYVSQELYVKGIVVKTVMCQRKCDQEYDIVSNEKESKENMSKKKCQRKCVKENVTKENVSNHWLDF